MCFTGPLERVRVAAPCAARWDGMRGDDRVRFCEQCNLHVYNLSALTKREAERLITSTEDRLCVRFYQRADSTILTRNCPVGLHAIKRRVSIIAGAAFAAVTTFLIGVGVNAPARRGNYDAQTAPPAAEEAITEYPYTECMGTCGSMITNSPIVPGGLLGSVVFLFGYPLLKLREHREARRSAALHIWCRNDRRGT